MRAVFEHVRRPEYTGENRCWPCTAINAVVVAVGAAVLVAAGFPAVAVAVAVVGAALVVVRGYVVPYTPQFAPRLVAWLPGDVLDHDVPRGGADGSLSDGDVDPEVMLSTLVEAGVVEPAGESLQLADEFRERWHEEMADLADADDADLAAAVQTVTPAADVDVVDGLNHRRVVLREREDADAGEVWLSRQVAVAEAAAVRALPETVPDDQRIAAAGPLRMFLQRCPTCGTPVEESTTATCCGGLKDPQRGPEDVLVCPDCDVRLFTF